MKVILLTTGHCDLCVLKRQQSTVVCGLLIVIRFSIPLTEVSWQFDDSRVVNPTITGEIRCIEMGQIHLDLRPTIDIPPS